MTKMQAVALAMLSQVPAIVMVGLVWWMFG